jgi:hypothetical protein
MNNCGHAFEGLTHSIQPRVLHFEINTRQNEPAPTNALVGRSVHTTNLRFFFIRLLTLH